MSRIEIPLTKGYVAIIDDADAPLVAPYKWSVHDGKRNAGNLYAVNHKVGFMHRLILGCSKGDGVEVDHEDGNGLHNRRNNLRKSTSSQNKFNMKVKPRGLSRFKGVYWEKARGVWHAQIAMAVGGVYRRFNLGRFVDEESAARAYDRKAIELFGTFARLNFPGDP